MLHLGRTPETRTTLPLEHRYHNIPSTSFQSNQSQDHLSIWPSNPSLSSASKLSVCAVQWIENCQHCKKSVELGLGSVVWKLDFRLAECGRKKAACMRGCRGGRRPGYGARSTIAALQVLLLPPLQFSEELTQWFSVSWVILTVLLLDRLESALGPGALPTAVSMPVEKFKLPVKAGRTL